MPRASFKSNLDCHQCGAHIIKDGRLTCPRCNQSIEMASESDILIDDQGRWKCQKCLEHGKNPKTLAIKEEIKCRTMCEAMNSIIEKENNEMEETNEITAKATEFVNWCMRVLARIDKKSRTTGCYTGVRYYRIETSFLKYKYHVYHN